MTNNFEVTVTGKEQKYLVHSRMKKNHKLFVDETPEHMQIVKQSIQDIIKGKEPTLAESRKKAEKKSQKDIEAERKVADEEKTRRAHEQKEKLASLASKQELGASQEAAKTKEVEDEANKTKETSEKKQEEAAKKQKIKRKPLAKAKTAQKVHKDQAEEPKSNTSSTTASSQSAEGDGSGSRGGVSSQQDALQDPDKATQKKEVDAEGSEAEAAPATTPSAGAAEESPQDDQQDASRAAQDKETSAGSAAAEADPADVTRVEKAKAETATAIDAVPSVAFHAEAEANQLNVGTGITLNQKEAAANVFPSIASSAAAEAASSQDGSRVSCASHQTEAKSSVAGFFGFTCCRFSRIEDSTCEAPDVKLVADDDLLFIQKG